MPANINHLMIYWSWGFFLAIYISYRIIMGENCMSTILKRICDYCQNVCTSKSIKLSRGLTMELENNNAQIPVTRKVTGRRNYITGRIDKESSNNSTLVFKNIKSLDFCNSECLIEFIRNKLQGTEQKTTENVTRQNKKLEL